MKEIYNQETKSNIKIIKDDDNKNKNIVKKAKNNNFESKNNEINIGLNTIRNIKMIIFRYITRIL